MMQERDRVNVLIVGGSGLLGTYAVREALARGHTVTALARGQSDSTGPVRWLRGDLHRMSEDELRAAVSGQDAVVYAMGLDDRETHPRPSFPVFYEDHVTVCLSVLRAAREAGARKFVVLGSYFTHIDEQLPELNLSAHHPYIRSRRDQRKAVLEEARAGFDTYVLELPYIIGSLPGRVPPWSFLFSMLAGRGKLAFFFDRGGTAAVTARQVAQAAMGALEPGVPSQAYALGGVNWSWPEWAERFFAVSLERKALAAIPRALFAFFGLLSALMLRLRGRERGLSIGRFAELQYRDAFVDPAPAQLALGYPHDDYDGALAEQIRQWMALRRPRPLVEPPAA